MKVSFSHGFSIMVMLSTFGPISPVSAVPRAESSRADVQAAVPNVHANALLVSMHRMNAMELELAKLAQTKSSSEAVKKFARQLSDHHEVLQKKVTDAASDRNVSVGVANETPSGESAQTYKNESMTQLDNLSGADFDQAFLKQVAQDHAQILKTIRETESKLSDAPDIQDLVKMVVPQFEQHRKQAIALQAQVAASKK